MPKRKEKYSTIIILPKKKSKIEEKIEEILDFLTDRTVLLFISYSLMIFAIYFLLYLVQKGA